MSAGLIDDIGLAIFECDGVLVDSERKLDLLLGRTGLRHLFDAWIHSGSEVGRGNPSRRASCVPAIGIPPR